MISHENWDDLKDLRIGYLRGWKIYEMNVGDGSDITILENVESMFNMLLADRLDIILYSKLRAIQYIQDNNIEELEINNPPLSERPMYLYLNKKHIDLIPLIEQELKTLKEKGKYDEFYNQYLINP